ncbi:MAG: glutathione S-transferase family protein [Pseudomonadales bacterium]
MYKLIIANRNYSSWSLRAWLFLTKSNVPFEEIRIPMFTETWRSEIVKYSPAGRVPVLLDDDLTVWDTTAIIDCIREKHPRAVGWPDSTRMRAHARSVTAEMHSGFLAVRDQLPQNIRARNKLELSQLSESCGQQIARIDEIWTDYRRKYGDSGEWLFGEFSIADIFFTPVALRFVTYSIPVSDKAKEFVDAVTRSELVQQWIEAARAEPESISFIDELDLAASSPLTLG